MNGTTLLNWKATHQRAAPTCLLLESLCDDNGNIEMVNYITASKAAPDEHIIGFDASAQYGLKLTLDEMGQSSNQKSRELAFSQQVNQR